MLNSNFFGIQKKWEVWVQNSIFLFILGVKLSGEPANKRGKLPGVFSEVVASHRKPCDGCGAIIFEGQR